MIDMTKQYTYQGKQVRIYADGSDTDNSTIHGAYKSETSGRWVLNIFKDSELVEVWEPKEGELVWCWDDGDSILSMGRFKLKTNMAYVIGSGMPFANIAPYNNSTLPEAFKGL